MEIIILIAIIYFFLKAVTNRHSSTPSNNPQSSVSDNTPSIEPSNDQQMSDNRRAYLELLKHYYKNHGDEMFYSAKIKEFQKDCDNQNIDTSSYDISEDLRKIRVPTKSKFTEAEREASLRKRYLNSNYYRPTQTQSNTVNNYNSYMKILKQQYLQYGEEMFLPSKVQNFIDEYQLDSKLGIHSDDVVKDLWKIKKMEIEENNSTVIPSEQLKSEQTPIETTTPPVQAQRTQTQNTNAIQPEEDEHDYLEKRGIDKDFGIRNDEHGDFYFFVINMSNTELINTINNQYKAIKGTWNLAPCMGEYGCIEFAATLLLWKYAVINFNKNPKAYASLQIMLGDLICCAFFGMPAGEWSDKVDPIINSHTDILSYDEFGSVYNYLRNNFADRIHSLEFNEGNAEKEAYRHLYTKFTEMYNSMYGFSDTINFYADRGLKIKNDIHFNILN